MATFQDLFIERRRQRRRYGIPRGIPAADTEQVITGGSPSPTPVSNTLLFTELTTGATGGSEVVSIANGVANDDEKIIELVRLVGANDFITMEFANLESIDGRPLNELLLTKEEHHVSLRWNSGSARWKLIRHHRGVTIGVA